VFLGIPDKDDDEVVVVVTRYMLALGHYMLASPKKMPKGSSIQQ
jgi:hypothetical protein